MHRLSSDLLLSIFKCLDSREMVNVMRVQKEWLETIDENKALWRRLVLPKPKQNGRWDLGGWSPSIVEVFDRKSDSSLKEVSMETNIKLEEVEALIKVLEKSKETLRILRIKASYYTRRKFAKRSLELLNLVECQLRENSSADYQVHLIHKDLEEVEAGDLRILWCPRPHALALKSFSHHLANLASLHLDDYVSSSEWTEILEASSKLRHLGIRIRSHSDDHLLSPIHLPHLEVLQIGHEQTIPIPNFPSWIRVGSSLSTLICHDRLYSSRPSVSTLWIDNDLKQNLEDLQCPELVELRINSSLRFSAKRAEALLPMLKQRKRNVDAGREIEGVKMVQLKRLIINLSMWESWKIAEMKELVEEVSDLASAPPIELEI